VTPYPGPMPPLSPAELAPLRRRRGPVLAWLLGALGLGLAAAGVWAVFWPYLNHDVPELIDDPALMTALAPPCAAVQGAASLVDVSAPGADQARQLTDVVVAIDALAAAVGALPPDLVGNDNPTRSWVADWQTLGSRVTDYSAALDDGAPGELDTPLTQDGYTVVTRMDLAAPLGCEVPAVLVALDPTPPPSPSLGW